MSDKKADIDAVGGDADGIEEPYPNNRYDDTLTLTVPLDGPRRDMFECLIGEMGEERATRTIESNMQANAQQVITQLYEAVVDPVEQEGSPGR
jgi:hypothetical protein